MECVAVIHGIPVYSDKGSADIINNRVVFGDGSWCDVATGQSDNRGPGQIRIGGTPEDAEAQEVITRGPKLYEADSLELQGLTGDASVEPYDGVGIEVTITGPKSAVEAISVQSRNGILVISEERQPGVRVRSITTQSSRRRRSFLRGAFSGSISLSIVDGNQAASVAVKVPRETPITVENDFGSTAIGDVCGRLTVDATGSGSVTAGRMGSVDLQTRSIGSIRVADANGSATVRSSGSGNITVGGSVSSLDAQATSVGSIRVTSVDGSAAIRSSGSGSVHVDGGSVTRLDAKAISIGKITVAQVNGPATVRSSGSGNITVGSGSIDMFDVSAVSIGKVTFHGTAQRAKLRSSGSGSIVVDHVVEQPDQRATSIGKIHVRHVG